MHASTPRTGTYQHFKGAFYEVLGIADEPASGSKYVVYQSLGITENILDTDPSGPILGHRVGRNGSKGALSVCTIERFFEQVEGKEYSQGKKVPRFRLVSAAP